MTTVLDAFDLPTAEQLTAMGFVVRLQDDAAAADKLVDDYVVTPTVAEQLPEIMGKLEAMVKRREDYGRFVHGSFGSGKSHFMSLLALLLEDHDRAWAKNDPALQALTSHRAWVRQHRPLVIRVHMLSQSGRTSGLDDILYAAFNRAMRRHGKPECGFRDARKVYEEALQEAKDYGDAFYRRLEEQGITDREDFDALADADAEELEDFARAWLEAKGGDTSVLDMPWGTGLQKMATHAREQGFGCIVLLVDEMLLWLGEKEPHIFRAEVNRLNTIVDHATGERSIPVAVFVARQRKLSDFFPDLDSDDDLHEYIDHHSKRFELTTLQDVELRHIVHGRVLKPKRASEVEAVRKGIVDRHAKVLKGVLAGVDADYLHDVFPFHPALIEMLVDVSSLLQRERSALTLLYELLVKHYPNLPLGEFLPVGSAFEAIFPQQGLVESNRKQGELQKIHQAWWMRLKPAMDERMPDLTPERRKLLEQVVKTVLLAEVSPRLNGAGTTVEKAVQLNSADAEGHLSRGLYSEVYTDLVQLQQLVPDLQVVGSGKTADLSFDLGSVNFGELLSRARAKVDNPNKRLVTFYEVLKQELGIDQRKGFRPGDGNEGALPVSWRATGRQGFLKLGNVRTLRGDDLQCNEDFRIVVDYPWDEPGHSVAEDRHRAQKVQKKHRNQYTICGLPRHFTTDEAQLVGEVAAARYLMSSEGHEELLAHLSATDQATVQDRARTHESQMRRRLTAVMLKAYRDNGECVALQSGVTVDPKTFPELKDVLEHIAIRLMDRRWPQHPDFRPFKTDTGSLRTLLGWLVDASDSAGHSVHFNPDQHAALQRFGHKLELVDLGQNRGSLRVDSRYIKAVLERSDRDVVDWDPIAEHLEETFGFQKPLRDLFLAFLCRARGYRALHATTGEPLNVDIGSPPASVPVRLQRARLLDHAKWSRLRGLAPSLLDVERLDAHRSVGAQDAAAERLKDAASTRRDALTAVHKAVVELGAADSDRTQELKEALSRLAPLVGSGDSYDRLHAFLAAWPEVDEDPVATATRQAVAGRMALQAVDRRARDHLVNAKEDRTHGHEIVGHLDKLTRWLGSEERTEALVEAQVERWNTKAHELLNKVIRATPPPRPPTPKPPPGRHVRPVFTGRNVDLKDPSSLKNTLAELEQELAKSPQGKVRITVQIEWDE